MALLHDAETRQAIRQRVAALTPMTERRWGKMTVDQMLWHVNCSLENALGRYDVKDVRLPLPKSVVKFIVLKLPVRHKSAQTAPEYVAKGRHDFELERSRCFRLIDELTAKPLDASWRDNAFMGEMTGTDWSTLQAKHLDHHLTQFGV
jgi:hypothetical protein